MYTGLFAIRHNLEASTILDLFGESCVKVEGQRYGNVVVDLVSDVLVARDSVCA